MIQSCPMKSYKFYGSIACPRDTLTALCGTSSGARSTVPCRAYTCTHICVRTCTRMCTIPSVQMDVCTWPHFASLFLLLSLSFIFALLLILPGHHMYHQLVRPCGQTGESDKRQGRPGPPGNYKIRNSSKTARSARAKYRSRYSVSRTRITCARFIKIKEH